MLNFSTICLLNFEGNIRTQWKISKICPLHESNSKSAKSNLYRPIAFLSVLSEIIERPVYRCFKFMITCPQKICYS